MEKLRSIDENTFVSAGLGPFDLGCVADQNVDVVINLISDEEAGVAGNEMALRHAAQRAGISFFHVPVSPADILEPEFTKDFGVIFNSIEGRVLVNCKSGTRAALAIANQLACYTPTQVLLETMGKAGFDFLFLNEEFAQRHSPTSGAGTPHNIDVAHSINVNASACA